MRTHGPGLIEEVPDVVDPVLLASIQVKLAYGHVRSLRVDEREREGDGEFHQEVIFI